MTIAALQTTARCKGLEEFLEVLQVQAARRYDAVVPLQAIEAKGGLLHVIGMGKDGPAGEPGIFTVSDIMDGHIADRLGVPVKYVRWMHANRPDLYDLNVNGIVHGCALGRDEALVRHIANDGQPDESKHFQVYAPDDRTVLLRTFTTDEGPGFGRAMLSDRYASYDNIDMLFAVLEGIAATGVEARVKSCDLSERRMVVKIEAPEIAIPAPELLKGYRSPFGDAGGGTYGTYGHTARQEGRKVGDIVSAGLVATNGETGGSSLQVAPYFTVLQCTNGMVMSKYASRCVHLGGKLEAGEVRWSEDTEQKNMATVMARTRDAVTAFLDVDFMTKVLGEVTEKAVRPIENPAAMVELVSNRQGYTEEQQAGILDHFIKGGQMTCGGILQAVTSFAQEIANPDTAFDFEATGIDAMEVAWKEAEKVLATA
jgi:hypothetical protein